LVYSIHKDLATYVVSSYFRQLCCVIFVWICLVGTQELLHSQVNTKELTLL